MARYLRRKAPSRRTDTGSTETKSVGAESPQVNGKKELDAYIEEFITNGLKLQQELMVNHEAIDAARREYLAEFQRRRQSRQ